MKINVNGVTLYYQDYGYGKPLIMLHGNGEDHRIFQEAANILQHHYHVYCIDSRGHGQSSAIKEYHYQDMADDIYYFIEELHLMDVAIYGFSDGGIVSLLLASQHPSLISECIVSGANLNPRGVSEECFLQTQMTYKQTKDPLVGLMLKEPKIKPKDLSTIQAKTLVMAGEYDLIQLSHTTLIHQSIQDSELMIIEGEDHGSYIVHNDKIARLIDQFIKRATSK